MNSLPPSGDPLVNGGFDTLAAHYGEHRFAHGGAAAPPIYQSSTFVYPDAEAFDRRDLAQSPYYDYTRRSNPTTALLEAKLAKLERGTWARCFASGMGAITAAINLNVSSGAHIVAVGNCYTPTHRYLHDYLKRFDVSVTFVHDADPSAFVDALREETALLYLESPTFGLFDVLDVSALTTLARERGILTIFDNSWATPCFQNPLELGCDLVIHSATKYIGGHSDALGGVIVGRDEDLRQRVAIEGELLGATLDPFASWLLLRGLRSLRLRMEQHQRSGLAVARMLAEHPKVQHVRHPGLETHPQHALATRHLRGFAGMFSFALSEQSREATHRVLNRLRLFHIGPSWGGYESLAVGGLLFNHDPKSSPWLIRLHCGLESTEDLVADVCQALED